MKTENDKINKILKEYSSIKDMIENLNSSINIDIDLIIKYSKGCDQQMKLESLWINFINKMHLINDT